MIRRIKIAESVPLYSPQNTIGVNQGHFGYLSPQVSASLGFTKQETANLIQCVALILRDRSTLTSILAHIDRGTSDPQLIRESIFEALGREIRFDYAVIAYSRSCYKGNLTSAHEFARSQAEVVDEISQNVPTGRIGITLGQSIYVPRGIHEKILTSTSNIYFSNEFSIMELRRGDGKLKSQNALIESARATAIA